MPTLTEYEHRISDGADADHQYLSRGQVKRLARSYYERQMRMADVDADLRILGYVSDPTPTQAVRNLANDRAAARRLGLA